MEELISVSRKGIFESRARNTKIRRDSKFLLKATFNKSEMPFRKCAWKFQDPLNVA